MSISLPAGPLPSPADDIVPPLKNRPAMREPLPGWVAPEYGSGLRFDAGGRLRLIADHNGEWSVEFEGADGYVAPQMAPIQLAAEDAARAMVAAMANALGGSVTWESEGSDGPTLD